MVCSALMLLSTINSTCPEGYCLRRCDVVSGRRLQMLRQTSGIFPTDCMMSHPRR